MTQSPQNNEKKCECGCHTSPHSDKDMVENGCDYCHDLYHLSTLHSKDWQENYACPNSGVYDPQCPDCIKINESLSSSHSKNWETLFDKKFAWLYNAEATDSRVKHDLDYKGIKDFISSLLACEKAKERERIKEAILKLNKDDFYSHAYLNGFHAAADEILFLLNQEDHE